MSKNGEGVPSSLKDPNDDPSREHQKSHTLHRETKEPARGDTQQREQDAQRTIDRILGDSDLELDENTGSNKK